ncbi:MAG: vacuolar-type H+-ATPase subunit F/Vma7 [Psychromonas sp.]
MSLDPIYGVKVVKKQPALTSSKGVDEDTVSNKILQEVDTVYLSKEEVMNLSTENDLKIILVKSSLSSELANFILRVNYKKSYLNQEGSMFVILHDVPITEQELIKKKIKKMQSNY